ncbi:MAG: sulfatase [Dehalococcoidia bacterium]|nr:sulfatase [Dehalococcoidia bacterium]
MKKPNLIYIQSDQHNPAIMGCAGDPIIDTPNLDKLANRGTIIQNAYAASPICVPSRMAAITGLKPHQSEVWTNDQILNSAIPTYAHSLGANGYKPVQVGRMHFNGIDQYHGFSERLVGDHGHNHLGSSKNPGTHGELNGTAGPNRISLKASGIGQTAYQVHDEIVTAETVKYIDDLGNKKIDNQPISLSIGLMLPHQPFIASKEDYEKYEKKVGMPKIPPTLLDECHPYIKWWRQRTGIEEVTEEEIVRCRIAYYALVDRMDKIIGSILDSLERNGLMENTMIVYTSDHGEQLGEHGLWWKQTFYENSVKVPAIISWPGHLPEGQVLNSVVNQYDLIATMLDASNSPKLPRSNGKSLLEHLKDPKNSEWENIAFSEYCMDDSSVNDFSGNLMGNDVHAKEGGVQNRMVRKDNYKLIYYHGYEAQLFDLDSDPDELNDLSNNNDYLDKKNELLELLLKDWDPEKIHKRMIVLKDEQKIQQGWARNTNPDDTLRWELDPIKDSTRLD